MIPFVGCRVEDPAQVEGKTPPSKVMSIVTSYWVITCRNNVKMRSYETGFPSKFYQNQGGNHD